MKKLDTLKTALEAAIANYDSIKDDIATASERVNVAAQLFSMNEVDKDVLVKAIELRDEIKASKASAWDKVVEADVAYRTLTKSVEREAKVKDLKAKLKALSK